MRRFLAVLTWVVGTAVVCALAWTAVLRVASDVSDHPTVVGSRTIRDELRPPAAGAAGDGSGTTVDGVPVTNPDGTPAFPGASPGDVAAGPGSGTNPTGATGGTAGTTRGGGSGGAGSTSGRTGSGNSSGTPTTTVPATPTTTTTAPPAPPVSGPESTVITTGGSVTAACSAGLPRLVRAIPNAGFGVQVGGSGGQIVVRLGSSSHLSVVEIECEGTRVQFSTSEESTG